MCGCAMNGDQLHGLLYLAVETEHGGVAIYETPTGCALHDDLAKEWQDRLEQTTKHEAITRTVLEGLGLDIQTV